MTPIAGWAAHLSSPDVAHAIRPMERDDDGRVVYWTLCGALRGAQGWTAAGPGVTRCRECYGRAAGAPDVD